MADKPEITQMVILPIPSQVKIENPASIDGRIWAGVLKTLKQSKGFKRMYWGRQVETPSKVQLHIGML